ncbi:MAG: adenosylcobinamide-GDP ribazoletransferase [Chloroflexi bacterium]|nr:adenosylcobinamide-GDP ribazoletransferase [Chloroflexota bacterium]
MRFLAALSFLTSIPINLAFTPNQVGRSLTFFPVIGLIVGAILVALDFALSRVFPALVVNALVIGASIVLTGALHLDGWMDFCDAMFGHKTLDARLRIMREPQVGAFGVAGAIILLLIKFAALASLAGGVRSIALLLAPLIARWAIAYALFIYPYARAVGKGSAFKEHARKSDLWIGTILALVIAMVIAQVIGAAMLMLAWLIVLGIARFSIQRIEGLTGDVYGAMNEIIETTIWILLTTQ